MTNSTVPTVRPGDRVFEEARRYGSHPWSTQDFFRGLLVQDVQLLKILESHGKDTKTQDIEWKISAVWARAFETLKFIDSLPDPDFFKPCGGDAIAK
jgi:hypothetical protein